MYLTDKDYELFQTYLEDFISSGVYDVRKYLDNFWLKPKVKLINSFKGRLIIKKPIDIQLPLEPTELDDWNLLRNDFITHIEEHISSYLSTLEEAFVTNNVISAKALHSNRIECEKVTITFNNVDIQFQNNMKTLKALRQIAIALDILEEYETFRKKLSQIKSEEHIEGNLCLSIHPLDYVTASDSNHFKSCISWTHNGEKRGGTLSLLSSSTCIVAYVESTNSKFKYGDFEWNDKKWRSFYYVDDNVICGIKGYPFISYALDKLVLDFIKEELYPSDWEYKEYSGKYEFQFSDTTCIKVVTENAMYNDFGCVKGHNAYISTNFTSNEKIHELVLDAPAYCLHCHRQLEPVEEDYGECDRCYKGHCCAHCGGRLSDKDNWIKDNGYLWHSDCYEDVYNECDISNDFGIGNINYIGTDKVVHSRLVHYTLHDRYIPELFELGYIRKYNYYKDETLFDEPYYHNCYKAIVSAEVIEAYIEEKKHGINN